MLKIDETRMPPSANTRTHKSNWVNKKGARVYVTKRKTIQLIQPGFEPGSGAECWWQAPMIPLHYWIDDTLLTNFCLITGLLSPWGRFRTRKSRGAGRVDRIGSISSSSAPHDQGGGWRNREEENYYVGLGQDMDIFCKGTTLLPWPCHM